MFGLGKYMNNITTVISEKGPAALSLHKNRQTKRTAMPETQNNVAIRVQLLNVLRRGGE